MTSGIRERIFGRPREKPPELPPVSKLPGEALEPGRPILASGLGVDGMVVPVSATLRVLPHLPGTVVNKTSLREAMK